MGTPHNTRQHIAIIMDGNGRWAKARGLPRILGHHAGSEAVRRVVEAARELNLGALTLYGFSWENWNRPSDEVQELMLLLDQFLRQEEPRLHAQQIRLCTIGRLEKLPPAPQDTLRRVMAATSHYTAMTLTLALSYGGRQELVDAMRRIAERVRAGTLHPDQITEAVIAEHLYTAGMPDPDLLIRTSGEARLSNFLLWQTSYTELYVTQKLWPEFGKEDLVEAIAEYERRERRFGKTVAHTTLSS